MAVFAGAGAGTLPQGDVLARAMLQALFEEGTVRLGPLTQVGREAMSFFPAARSYTLFGDPAMRLAIRARRAFLPIVLRGN